MKKILLIGLFLFIYKLNAQTQEIIVSTGTLFHDSRKIPAKEVMVNGKPEEALANFRSLLSKQYKVKSKIKKGTLEAKGALINGLIDKRGDLTVTSDAVGEQTLVKAAFALGYDIIISEENYAEDFEKLGILVTRFAKNHQLAQLQAMLKAQKKELKDKEKLLSTEQSALKTYERQLKSLKKSGNADKLQVELTEQKVNTSKELIDIQKSAVKDLKNLVDKTEATIKQIKAKL
ncbi:MAG: hypothetical protein ACK4GL_09025 [Flavobacteriales bacterium]